MHHAPSTSVASSACSDLREINEAKFSNIMNFLESASPPKLGQGPRLTSEVLDQGFGAPTSSSWCCAQSAKSFQNSACTNITNIDTPSGVYSGIKSKIEAMRESNSHLQHESAALQKKIEQQKEKEKQRVTRIQSLAQAEIDKLKTDYEATCKRQNHLIHELMRDKDAATHALDTARRELHALHATQDMTAKQMEDIHVATIAELKGKWGAQEKAKREQWALKEAKKIKEATLRAMEPDIALLMNRHKAEKARLGEEYQEAIKRKEEAMAAREISLNEIKAKMTREAEELILRERDSYRERLKEECDRVNRQLEEERKTSQQKREALESFHTEQKNVVQCEMRQLEKELFALRSQVAEGTAKFHVAVSSEASKIAENSNQKMGHLKSTIDAEHREWLENAKKQNAAYLADKEQELRRQATNERDAAIAKVIQQLENEHISALGSLKDNEKVQREKYVKQDRELERVGVELQLTLDQLRKALAVIRCNEEKIAALEKAVETQKETLVKIHAVKEREFDSRLQFLDAEWQQKLRRFESQHVDEVERAQHNALLAQKDIERERERFAVELRALEHRHSAELSSINDKVLVAVAKRDGTIRTLQEQVVHLEGAVREREDELNQTKHLLR